MTPTLGAALGTAVIVVALVVLRWLHRERPTGDPWTLTVAPDGTAHCQPGMTIVLTAGSVGVRARVLAVEGCALRCRTLTRRRRRR